MEHPVWDFAARFPHYIDNALEILQIILGVICNCFTHAASTTCTTDTVDVACRALRKVIVDDEIDAFEIKTTSHEFRSNKDPDFALAEGVDDIFTLIALLVNSFARRPHSCSC